MKLINAITTLALLFLSPLVALGAAPVVVSNVTGTVSISEYQGDITKSVLVSWTSDASGDANSVISPFVGEMLRVSFDPGTASPTASYDIVLNDSDSVDVLGGAGANLSATVTSSQAVTIDGPGTDDHLPCAVTGKLTLVVSNAGNAKTGTMRLYWRR